MVGRFISPPLPFIHSTSIHRAPAVYHSLPIMHSPVHPANMDGASAESQIPCCLLQEAQQ